MADDVTQRPAADGINTIAVHEASGKSPGILLLHGFRSDMNGSKAAYLIELTQKLGLAFTRLDYRGHGSSTGHYADFTASDWFEDVLQVFDQTTGPQIVIGSSLGGWLMCRLAKQRPERIHGLIGIAAAPDFPAELILPRLTPAQKETLEREGRLTAPSDFGDPTIFTQKLIDDSVKNPVLGTPLSFKGPVRLLQGMKDEDVPWRHALRLMEIFPEADVRLTLFKDGGHRLAEPPQLEELGRTVEEIIR